MVRFIIFNIQRLIWSWQDERGEVYFMDTWWAQ